MSCWIRKVDGERSTNFLLLAPDSWDLRHQFKIFEEWLVENNGTLEPADNWIADIGFKVRLDATGGGPIVSTKLMALCISNRVELFLSEYGSQSED